MDLTSDLPLPEHTLLPTSPHFESTLPATQPQSQHDQPAPTLTQYVASVYAHHGVPGILPPTNAETNAIPDAGRVSPNVGEMDPPRPLPGKRKRARIADEPVVIGESGSALSEDVGGPGVAAAGPGQAQTQVQGQGQTKKPRKTKAQPKNKSTDPAHPTTSTTDLDPSNPNPNLDPSISIPAPTTTTTTSNSSSTALPSGPTSIPPNDDPNAEGEDEVKKRKELNRLAAERSRSKKRGELAILEKTVTNIQAENDRLRTQLEALLVAAGAGAGIGAGGGESGGSGEGIGGSGSGGVADGMGGQGPSRVGVAVTGAHELPGNNAIAGSSTTNPLSGSGGTGPYDPSLSEQPHPTSLLLGPNEPVATTSSTSTLSSTTTTHIQLPQILLPGTAGLNLPHLAGLIAEVEALRVMIKRKEGTLEGSTSANGGTSGSAQAQAQTQSQSTASSSRTPITDPKEIEKQALLATIEILTREREEVELERKALGREISLRKAMLAAGRSKSAMEGSGVDGDGVALLPEGGDVGVNASVGNGAVEEEDPAMEGVGVERALLDVRGWLDDALNGWKKTGIIPSPASTIPIIVNPPLKIVRKPTKPRQSVSNFAQRNAPIQPNPNFSNNMVNVGSTGRGYTPIPTFDAPVAHNPVPAHPQTHAPGMDTDMEDEDETNEDYLPAADDDGHGGHQQLEMGGTGSGISGGGGRGDHDGVFDGMEGLDEHDNEDGGEYVAVDHGH